MARPLPSDHPAARHLLPSVLPAVLVVVLLAPTPPPLLPGGSSGPASAPVLSQFFVTPANLTLGGTAEFVVLASGGIGPLSYSYRSLPPGCTSENTSILPCTPNGTGVFAVIVTVSDSTGTNVSGATALAVFPSAPPPPVPSPLVLLTFLVYPTSITLGNYTVFVAAATGGVTPLSYEYSNLPPGCIALPLPVVPCRPSAAGSYAVSVTVVDADGTTAHGQTSLVVASDVPASPTTSGAGNGATTTQLWEYAGGGAVAGAGAMALVALLVARWRQSRRRP